MMQTLKLIGAALLFLPLFFGGVTLAGKAAEKTVTLGWLIYALALAVSLGTVVMYGVMLR